MSNPEIRVNRRQFMAGSLSFIGLGILAGCESKSQPTTKETILQGDILIDGSSTVFPISEAVAEEFMKKYPKVRVTVGISGTGGGFKKFCSGEIDISDASRPIAESEKKACAEKDIQHLELAVAFDGLSVLVHPSNTFVNHLTTAELKKIWEPESAIKNWKDVRPGFPDLKLELYGPGTDSGTFDYFTGAINGKEKSSRPDFSASEDDNVLVKGIAGDKGALGYFGYAYYVENRDKLKLVAVDGGKGPVFPSEETIINGTYQPLSRPIFIYPSLKALRAKTHLAEFVKFYLAEAPELVKQVGYVPLPARMYSENLAKLETAIK